MNATKFIHIIFTACFTLVLLFTSCKKKKEFKEEDGEASVEIRNAQAESDLALKEINEIMSNQWLLRGKSALGNTAITAACGYTVDTSTVDKGTIRLVYDGTVCNGRKREGIITLSVMNYPFTKLKNKGSRVKIDFDAYRATRITHGNSLQFDGTAYLENESGGSWFELLYLNQPALVQKLTADEVQAQINGSTSVFYTISRRYTFTCANTVISCVEEGTGSNNGQTGVENFGYTRARQKFTSSIVTPVRWNTICGPMFPLSGEVSISVEEKAFELHSLYGTDVNGDAITAAGSECTYGWKLSWSHKRKTKTRVFGYDN